jgi:hypothetical protein
MSELEQLYRMTGQVVVWFWIAGLLSVFGYATRLNYVRARLKYQNHQLRKRLNLGPCWLCTDPGEGGGYGAPFPAQPRQHYCFPCARAVNEARHLYQMLTMRGSKAT